MAEMFGHEKLKVYEKSLGFVGLRSELLRRGTGASAERIM